VPNNNWSFENDEQRDRDVVVDVNFIKDMQHRSFSIRRRRRRMRLKMLNRVPDAQECDATEAE
jgi:hypothetical protein